MQIFIQNEYFQVFLFLENLRSLEGEQISFNIKCYHVEKLRFRVRLKPNTKPKILEYVLNHIRNRRQRSRICIFNSKTLLTDLCLFQNKCFIQYKIYVLWSVLQRSNKKKQNGKAKLKKSIKTCAMCIMHTKIKQIISLSFNEKKQQKPTITYCNY